jgi:small subunit ribosomal protein S21
LEEIGLKGESMAGKSINVEVIVRRGEPLERAIRRFKKRVKKDGILEEHIKRKRYEKPSTTRRKKKLNRLRLIEKQNELLREDEQKLYKRSSKPKNKRSKR